LPAPLVPTCTALTRTLAFCGGFLAAAAPIALEVAVAAHGLVISLVPYTHHTAVMQAAIEGKTHIVTTSYISPALYALDGAARTAGIVVLNEAGLDPGIDHLSAVNVIDGVHAKGGKVSLATSAAPRG
jgi:saccharopine dehydrogenase-like NADP-dependent oxidoreductase